MMIVSKSPLGAELRADSVCVGELLVGRVNERLVPEQEDNRLVRVPDAVLGQQVPAGGGVA